MKRFGLSLILFAGLLANGQDLKKAEELYQHTDYSGSLKLLQAAKTPDAEALALMGRNQFMLGQYKQAVDSFQRAAALDPQKSDYQHWLGRTWGRRAETASPFTAPMAASKARQYFERAVQLDPNNQEALNDLFDYYLQAPGILGGGMDKATAVAKHIAELDTAEGYFAQAQLADRRKQYETAEQHLRRAMELAPRQVGRVLDLAKYLARHGRIQESETVFQQAEKIAPNSPKVMYTRAKVYIEEKRNLDVAKSLLQRYIQSSLTPEDPPREEAERLLKQVSTGV